MCSSCNNCDWCETSPANVTDGKHHYFCSEKCKDAFLEDERVNDEILEHLTMVIEQARVKKAG